MTAFSAAAHAGGQRQEHAAQERQHHRRLVAPGRRLVQGHRTHRELPCVHFMCQELQPTARTISWQL